MSAIPSYPKDEIAGVPGVTTIESERDLDKLDNKQPAGPNDTVYAVDNTEEHDPFEEIDQKYLVASKTTKFYRGVLLQMILFGALSFVGPSMNDAISNLGGGGLSTPYLANLAQALNYAMSCLMTLFGGPIVNKLGIKWTCLIGSMGFPLGGSGYYTRARLGVDWYLLFARALGGITSGFLYVGESTAMLSYPPPNDRGLYLGIWSAMRNSGSIMGGAINFATNYVNSQAGGIAWSTYIIFIAFECTGIFYALLLSPTSKVRRPDGHRIPASPDVSWGKEFKALWKHAQTRRTWLMFLPAFYSFFIGGTFGTYLSLNFSVRSRAVSSLIVPSFTVPLVVAYGKLILDQTRWSQKKRAWICVMMWVIPQGGSFVWVCIQIAKQTDPLTAWDYGIHGARWAEAYMPYAIMQVTSYWCQLSIYWILGTFTTDSKSASRTGGLFRCFETMGQAISYGINASAANKNIPMYVNIGFFAAALPCLYFLIQLVPEQPVDHDDVVDAHLTEDKALQMSKL